MPAPFLSYLRVYEPMRVFEGPSGLAVRLALARGPVAPEQAGQRERELCLRVLLRDALLPPAASDVLVLDPSAAQPLVCPLDTRARAAAALLAFLETEAPPLRAAALPVPEATVRRAALATMAELGEGAAHVVSASWTVPLPWFALVEPQERRLVLDGPRRVWWQAPIGHVRRRAVRAEAIVRDGVGETGPAEVLAETSRWLRRFDHESVVELDYGGIVELLDDDALRADRSAALVEEALRALRGGDPEGARARYDELREFWGAVVARQRAG
jgi:hypothetical protein